MNDVLTSPEVAQLLGCSPRTIHRRVDAGLLTPVRRLPGPNGGFLFERAEVEKHRQAASTDAPATSPTEDDQR